MNRILAVCIIFLLFFVGLSGMVNASDGTIWYQKNTFEYNLYVNSSVGHESSLIDNWISVTICISSVAKEGEYQDIKIKVSAVAYSNTSELYTTTDDFIDAPYKIIIKATADNLPENSRIDFLTSWNSGVNVTGSRYQGSRVDNFIRNATEFAADTLIGSIPYFGYGYSVAKFLANELSPKPVDNKYGCVGSGTAWESFFCRT